MEFNERLTQIRKQRGLSQESLAAQVGVSRQAVSKWETGEALPDYAKLVALVDALQVSIDFLCGREEQASTESKPSTTVPTPPATQKHSPLRFVAAVVLALFLFGGGMWLGSALTQRTQVPSMPDTVTVSGVQFLYRPSEGLFYQFIPSVAGDEYTYQIHFLTTSSEGKDHTIDVPLSNGACSGKVGLMAGTYTVTASISNGRETRLIPLATDLTFRRGLSTWSPAP